MCESAAQCFLLAFLTGSWCWVQLRTRKRPFLSSVNHLRQREKKKEEGRGGGKEPGLLHWFSPLRSFLPLPVFTFCTDWLFQLHFLTLCVIFTQLHTSAEGICGFTESSWAGWEDQGDTESKWSRPLWGAKLQVLLVQFEPHGTVYFRKKTLKYLHYLQLLLNESLKIP